MAYFKPMETRVHASILVIVPFTILPHSTVVLQRKWLATIVRDIAIAFLIPVHGVVHVVFASLRTRLAVMVANSFVRTVSQNCNINPRRWSPPRIVIAFLRAFKTVSISIRILTSATTVITIYLLISCVQTFVSFSVLTKLIVVITFLHTISLGFCGAWNCTRLIIVDSVSGCVIRIPRHTISWRGNIRTTTEMLSAVVRACVASLVCDPRPEIINARI
mmetsp:Transcript_10059/g.10871  ORF Transcript_10059/g.10871 Transcript_10059/m.10871 type:complete len:219 (+) Transcript_10059:2398-3054(+)